MGRKLKDNYVHSLQNDIDLLYTVCQEEASIDVTVEKFANFITERTNPLFQKKVKINIENVFTSANFAEKVV